MKGLSPIMHRPSPEVVQRMYDAVLKMASGETVGLLCGALGSAIFLTALSVAIYFVTWALGFGDVWDWGAEVLHFNVLRVQRPGLVVAIATCWSLGLLTGCLVSAMRKPPTEIGDNFACIDSYGNYDADLMALGCVVALFQFLGGNLYECLRALARGGDPNRREQQVASVLLAWVSTNSGASLKDLVADIQLASPSIASEELRGALRLLTARQWLTVDGGNVGCGPSVPG